MRKYKCDICDYQAQDMNNLNKHKADIHDQNKVTVDKKYLDGIVEENLKLKTELSNLKEDFERLNDIFENSRNSSQEQDKNSDVELNKVREEYRIIQTENEFLIEKNDTLFKLGKIALDKKETEPELEVFEDEDESGLDALVKSTLENNANRFVRRDPTSYAEKTKTKEAPKPAPQTSKVRGTPNAAEATTNSTQAGDRTGSRINYCHFFSNYGTCQFEEKNNRKCKFSHLKAPVCEFDGRCNRKKCMFSHTKPNISSYIDQV